MKSFLKIVSFEKSGTLEVPAILRLIVQRAVIMIIPERRSLTFPFTWISPVQIPARAPAAKAAGSVSQGFTPLLIRAAVTAAPRGKLPSVVRSGKSSILYVMYTPRARIP